MPGIVLENAVKEYPLKSGQKGSEQEKVTALDHCFLAVEDGEFLAVTGASGCGKSTLLRVISGLEQLTSGRICMDGQEMQDLPPSQRKVAMVFQEYALYPHMTAFENIAFPLINQGVKPEEIRKDIYHAAEILDIRYLLNRKPKNMSWGQRQRISVAKTICSRSPVLLMDEPLSGADEELRSELIGNIRRLHEEFRFTCLYVTHKSDEVEKLADRVIVMEAGKIVKSETIREFRGGVTFIRPMEDRGGAGYGNPEFDPVTGKMILKNDIEKRN